MCVVCSTLRSRQHEWYRMESELARWVASMTPVAPRRLLYGLFSESFELFGRKYCWAVEDGVLTLQKVTWDEEA